jgi:hypothetical protein
MASHLFYHFAFSLELRIVAGKKATSQQTIVKLLELSRRDHLPLSWTFVQQRTVDGKPSAGPLAAFVGAHHERALQQYLLLHAAVSAESEEEGWSVARDSRVWARALGLPEQMPAARAAVSKNWAWLEKRQLVTRGRRGRLSEVHLLYDDGSGDPYEHPADRNDSYLKLPYEFWRDEWHRELGLAGVTVLLIALTLRDGFYLPGDRVGAWYGISSSTLTKGFRALRQRQLLDVRRDAKTAELAPEGITYEYTYTLKPPFGPKGRRRGPDEGAASG